MRAIFFFFALIIFGCSSGIKDEASPADSTRVVTDSAIVVASNPVEPPIDPAETAALSFPTYSGEVFTEIEHEAAITRALLTLLGQYEMEKVVRIKSNSTITYMATNDYDDSKSKAVITETKTWYYNSARQLRAFMSAHKSDTDSTTTIYLFSDDKMIGAYQDNFYRGQDSGVTRGRWVSSKCPECGVYIQLNSQPVVTTMDETSFAAMSAKFFDDYNNMLNDLKRTAISRSKGHDILLTAEKAFDDTPYKLNYTANQSVYSKLLKGK